MSRRTARVKRVVTGALEPLTSAVMRLFADIGMINLGGDKPNERPSFKLRLQLEGTRAVAQRRSRQKAARLARKIMRHRGLP